MSRYDEIPLADGAVRIRELRRLLEKIDPRRRAGIVKLIAREEALAGAREGRQYYQRLRPPAEGSQFHPEPGEKAELIA